jgi:nucleoside-diphosphate-sugar epimerase
MRIIITGVSGFIGSNLCGLLLDLGYNVIGIDNFLCGYKENIEPYINNSLFTFYEMSILDKNIKSLIHEDDILIHLAAISSLATNQENPSFSYNNNICGTLNLLEISRIVGIKHFIFASTSAIYENNTEFPLDETFTTSPDLIYSLGKKHCEELIKSYNTNYGLSYSILRFFNVYGPNQDAERTHPALIPYIINCYKNNIIPLLHSDGNQKRDYVFIEDILSLFKILLYKEPINDIINVSSGDIISVVEIVDIIKSFFPNSQIEPIYRDPSLLWEKSDILWNGIYPFSKERMKQEVIKYTLGNTIKSKNLLNWEIKINMKEGLSKCI